MANLFKLLRLPELCTSQCLLHTLHFINLYLKKTFLRRSPTLVGNIAWYACSRNHHEASARLHLLTHFVVPKLPPSPSHPRFSAITILPERLLVSLLFQRVNKLAMPLYSPGINITSNCFVVKFAHNQDNNLAILTSYRQLELTSHHFICLYALSEFVIRTKFLPCTKLLISLKAQVIPCNSPKYKLISPSFLLMGFRLITFCQSFLHIMRYIRGITPLFIVDFG